MKKNLLMILCLCTLWVTAQAQDRTISGKVTAAEDGASLPGVNVIVQGTSKGTTTDSDGNYSLTLAPGENTLVFSFVGFKSTPVEVGTRTTVDLALESDITSLDEVVVVGYGTQRKVEVTGAIANVSGADIQKQPSVNPISGLQGRVAGVQITNLGQPGASPQIRIRGTGTVYGDPNPLYIVDGVWYNDISFLNPNDIEDISILKDASAQSIYGVRAANGVVLITTKKGSNDGTAVISYNGFVGRQVVTNQVEMATGPEYAAMINEMDVINGGTARYADPNSFGTTDWYGQILRAASISNHTVSLAGGNEKSTYNFSLGYLNQDGIVEGNSFKRYTARLQNDFKPFEFLRLGYTATGAFNKSADVPGGIFHQLYSASPITPVYYSDGTYGDPNDYRAGSSNLFNPQVTLDFNDQTSMNYRLTGNVFAELSLLKKLTFRTSLGGDFGQNEVRRYDPVYAATLSQRRTISLLTRERAENRNWILENTLSYDNTINEDHVIKVLVGQGAQQYRFYKLTGTAQNVPNNSVDDHYFRIGDPDTRFINDEGDLYTIASYFARVNYGFRDRYLLTASFRADGSSKFGANDRWGYFPSVGVGWVISEEGFMADQTIFDNLKLRASWGKIGNSSVPSNTAIQTVTQTPALTYVGGNGTISPGASIFTITPPTTVWERGVGTDIGLEAAVLDNRLTAEVDYYIKETQDAIFDIPILRSIGTTGSTIVGNQATFRNSGFEFALTWSEQKSNDFSYTVSANLGINENEVTAVSTGANAINKAVGTTGGATNTRTVVGQPIGHFYGFNVIGIFQSDEDVDSYTSSNGTVIQPNALPGDFKYQDVNNDGVIDAKDHVVLGNPNPKYIYGINTNWRYKAFDLTLDFQGVAGVEVYNATLGARFGTENFTREFYENRWNGAGTSNEYPSANIGGGQNYRSNSFFVESGSYFRVRNAQIGYTLPASTTSKWKISTVRIYANAQNAINVFKYRGFTPEIGGKPTEAGVDTNVYPMYATYNIGLNVSF
ncbi:MAG TPA: TonB-dependent receptor [Chryseosolibacter sp.]